VTKCIFPVAGLGTRFLPVTKSVPKELLPILNKPLIQYAIEEAIDAGIKNFTFITSKAKTAIKDYFSYDKHLIEKISNQESRESISELDSIISQSNFEYVNQDEMLGLGHAILCGKEKIPEGNSFAVILPDDLCHSPNKSVLSQLLELHKKYPDRSIIAVEEVHSNEVEKYGVISGRNLGNSKNVFEVSSLVEKPKPEDAPSKLAVIGRYILSDSIFLNLSKTPRDNKGEIQLTEALNMSAIQGKVLAYKFSGKRYDCGSVKGFIEAQENYKKFL